MFVEPSIKNWFHTHANREDGDEVEVCAFFKSPVMTPDKKPCVLTLGQVRRVSEGLKTHGNPSRHFKQIERWIKLTADRQLAPFEAVNTFHDEEREIEVQLNAGQVRRLRKELKL